MEGTDFDKELRFSPSTGVLNPREAGTIVITFTPSSCQSFRAIVACHTERGNAQRVYARAEVQAPKVVLDPLEFTEALFVRVPVTIQVTVSNFTDLASSFAWVKQNSDNFAIEFCDGTDNGQLCGTRKLYQTFEMQCKSTILI